MAVQSKSNEIRITRMYDAPVTAVWDAWTDPKQVAQWWGPRGFTITTHSKDLRAGGTWVYTMHGPDGTDWPNKTLYHVVEKHSKLVYDHGGNDDRPPMFRVTVLFSEVDGKTKMEMSQATASPGVVGVVASSGWGVAGIPSLRGSSTRIGPMSSPSAVPTSAPMRRSRPTSGSRQRPERARVHEISISGHRRRANGSSAM